MLLLALGLAWTRLNLGDRASRAALWLLIYSTFAILAAYLLGAFWGGRATIRFPWRRERHMAAPLRKA
ncbi:MAG TPA: hypothetical protein VFP37_00720 [Steroidobacteraceae bacterium]|nr:hypothetical protein [Steroidobacteraceae bacterium]